MNPEFHQFAVNFLLHLENASSLTSLIRLPCPPSFDYIDNKYYFTPDFAAGNMSVWKGSAR